MNSSVDDCSISTSSSTCSCTSAEYMQPPPASCILIVHICTQVDTAWGSNRINIERYNELLSYTEVQYRHLTWPQMDVLCMTSSHCILIPNQQNLHVTYNCFSACLATKKYSPNRTEQDQKWCGGSQQKKGYIQKWVWFS